MSRGGTLPRKWRFGTMEDFMNNQNDGIRRTPSIKSMTEAASEAAANVSEIARDTGAQAKQAFLDTASSAKDQVKDLLDRQLGTGIEIVGQFANSARLAATDMEQHSPLVAGLVGALANKVDDFAEDMQDRTVDHLTRSVTDLTRRQPALVFGIAALAGFVVYRAVKSTPPIEAPSIQPSAEPGMRTSNGL